MSANFVDQSSATQIMAGGSAGSFEFGGSAPSGTAGVCSVDGAALNNGNVINDGRVPPSANNRATGSVSLAAQTSASISTGKTSVSVAAIDTSDIAIQYLSSGGIWFFNYVFTGSSSCNYSYL